MLVVAARQRKRPGSQTTAVLGSRSLTMGKASGSRSVPMGSRSVTRARQRTVRLTLADNGEKPSIPRPQNRLPEPTTGFYPPQAPVPTRKTVVLGTNFYAPIFKANSKSEGQPSIGISRRIESKSYDGSIPSWRFSDPLLWWVTYLCAEIPNRPINNEFAPLTSCFYVRRSPSLSPGYFYNNDND